MKLRYVWATIKKYVESINKSMGLVSGMLLLLLIFTISFAVFCRFFLKSSQPVLTGLNSFFFGAAAMLGSGYAFLREAHVRMDIFYNKLNKRKQAMIDGILLPIAVYTVVFALIWKGTIAWWQAWSMNWRIEGIDVLPAWPLLIFIPIGSILLGAQAFVFLIKNLTYATQDFKGEKK